MLSFKLGRVIEITSQDQITSLAAFLRDLSASVIRIFWPGLNPGVKLSHDCN